MLVKEIIDKNFKSLGKDEIQFEVIIRNQFSSTILAIFQD
jgi:hypothetical protein